MQPLCRPRKGPGVPFGRDAGGDVGRRIGAGSLMTVELFWLGCLGVEFLFIIDTVITCVDIHKGWGMCVDRGEGSGNEAPTRCCEAHRANLL